MGDVNFGKNKMVHRGVKRSGSWGCKIIRTITKNGREYQLHATKGWRSYKAVN